MRAPGKSARRAKNADFDFLVALVTPSFPPFLPRLQIGLTDKLLETELSLLVIGFVSYECLREIDSSLPASSRVETAQFFVYLRSETNLNASRASAGAPIDSLASLLAFDFFCSRVCPPARTKGIESKRDRGKNARVKGKFIDRGWRFTGPLFHQLERARGFIPCREVLGKVGARVGLGTPAVVLALFLDCTSRGDTRGKEMRGRAG